MSDKPHLILNWVFDIPNQQLVCKINDDLTYYAIDGGYGGFTKIYKGITTNLTEDDWTGYEKQWISDTYGDELGMWYQKDPDRVVHHPETGWVQYCVNGIGPDGRYLDHMQRYQVLMEGHDMAVVWNGTPGNEQARCLFSTPDRGLTIYKRKPTSNTRYPAQKENPNAWWFEVPQPCSQQPYSKGYYLSNYDELLEEGCPQNIVDQCKRGEWMAPLRPDLQQWYIYPKTMDENPK